MLEKSGGSQGSVAVKPESSQLDSQHSASPADLRLITATHFYPAHGGGIEKVAEHLVNGLAGRGIHVCWLASNTDESPPQRAGVTIAPVPSSDFIGRLTQLPYPLWSPWSLPRLWREVGRADAVHVHEHLYLPSIALVAIARLRGRPVVITQHMGALGLGSRSLTLFYEFAARLLGRLMFPLAARTVFISHNVMKFFGRETSHRSGMIYNGVDTLLFVPASPHERRDLRKRLGLPLEQRVVLFVGRFVRKKGLHHVLELAQRHPDVTWVLAGSGPETPHRPPPNLFVAGRVEHEQLPQYYQAADLLILPSSGEGFPLVVQEALCCGTGVLSTDEVATACPEATDMIRACPVPRRREDMSGWETALGEVLSDPEYLSEGDRLERARLARCLWSWDRCVSQYEELFRELGTDPKYASTGTQ